MQVSDFDFDLPPSLIAKYPLNNRVDSRLMVVDEKAEIHHAHFYDLLDFLKPNDLLVFNNTRVIPARLFGQRPTGGKIEVLIERILSSTQALAHVRSNKKLKTGAEIVLDSGDVLVVDGRQGDLFILNLKDGEGLLNVVEASGHIPLPPYIDRDDEQMDTSRYQTVYAKEKGAVAAPTAGLHFDDALLAKIDALGIERAEVTLHVGAGTFQPVKVDRVEDHQMHSEYLVVDEAVCEAVKACRERQGRVIAVGTTTLRSLESAAQSGELKPFQGDSDIFIYPGYRFKVVDALITNFHLPKSTLLMLVSAFSGAEAIKKAYEEAIKSQYRFFSYGDAMFLVRR